ncbi:MAG: NAD(P)H-dependent oxidoreductase [Paracoccus sp. (in: a-proteobacteria)]|uniref:NAD(P)H-dependent oxidoreductase n=1 Tax=Paracoccus sp. TaxID=267 RepID=UPI0026DF0A57|nr:NAD(P)H-dependent oxidoreductase [Paracoccus sp. (in: a-proteobacteria)]MDO5613851.1 NAD(P)H-dependent oxidoreductase [Paracoccus sp. (in: a-proteobacteria)]
MTTRRAVLIGGHPDAGRLSGFISRVFLPGRAFRYHKDGPWWDRLLAGRSADVIVTMDTPPPFLRLAWFDPLGWRLKRQVPGFCGLRPLRLFYFGPVRRGGAERNLPRWRARLARAATTIPKPKGR